MSERIVQPPARLRDRTALVIGAGQAPGATVGNGRAAALLYAREGARVFAVDLDLDKAESTAAAIRDRGGTAEACQADASDEAAVAAAVRSAVDTWGRIDILHNNVGVSWELGDAPVTEITDEVFERITAINLKSMVLAAKHVVPIMRDQRAGVITNIGSIAAIMDYPLISYQTSKAGVLALTRNVAMANAPHGIRCNAILPGLMDTPKAVEGKVASGADREQVRQERDAKVPLGRMGTAWDVAHAAVFLASDDASFITGVALPVDGGQTLKIG